MLHNEFPVPSAIQAEADLFKYYMHYTGCQTFCVSMDCVCFSCTEMKHSYTMYAYGIMEASLLENIPLPGRKGPRSLFDYVSPNGMCSAISMVQHHCHFYEKYCLCSHSCSVRLPGDFSIYQLTSKHRPCRVNETVGNLKCMKMTPARLVFKERTNRDENLSY